MVASQEGDTAECTTPGLVAYIGAEKRGETGPFYNMCGSYHSKNRTTTKNTLVVQRKCVCSSQLLMALEKLQGSELLWPAVKPGLHARPVCTDCPSMGGRQRQQMPLHSPTACLPDSGALGWGSQCVLSTVVCKVKTNCMLGNCTSLHLLIFWARSMVGSQFPVISHLLHYMQGVSFIKQLAFGFNDF